MAQSNAGYDIWGLWGYFFRIMATATKMLWVLTVMVFLFGLVEFLLKAGSEAEQKKAKALMKGAIIAFFIATTFWGLVSFIISSGTLTPDDSSSIMTITSGN